MRTFLIALIVAMATWPLPSHAATRNFGINSFDRIRVEGPFKVQVAVGVAPFAKATGSPAALDRVKVEVQGRTLIVGSNVSGWGGYPGKDQGAVEIRVGTHELSQASLNGSGSLQIDKAKGLTFGMAVEGSGSAAIERADVDQLTVGLAGTSSASLGGRAGKLTASVRGVSSFDGSKLAVKDAVLRAEGPATVNANVSNAITVRGSGTATIALAGKPACTSKLVGSATISGCR